MQLEKEFIYQLSHCWIIENIHRSRDLHRGCYVQLTDKILWFSDSFDEINDAIGQDWFPERAHYKNAKMVSFKVHVTNTEVLVMYIPTKHLIK